MQYYALFEQDLQNRPINPHLRIIDKILKVCEHPLKDQTHNCT